MKTDALHKAFECHIELVAKDEVEPTHVANMLHLSMTTKNLNIPDAVGTYITYIRSNIELFSHKDFLVIMGSFGFRKQNMSVKLNFLE